VRGALFKRALDEIDGLVLFRVLNML